ncbi:hypothetical protein POMI540_4535 [Schizosaccharomyces pombe]
MSNPESPKKQVEPPGYNELFMVRDTRNVDLERGLELCKPEKVNKQNLFTNTIKPQEDIINIKTDKIKVFLNNLFTEISKFHDSCYPDGRISTRSKLRWPLLIIWCILIIFAIDKNFEVKDFLLIWINESFINENRFYSEIWGPIAIYVCLFVLLFVSLIFSAEFVVLALRETGMMIAVLGAALGMIMAALGATITGLLYFSHWAFYKVVILTLDLKIEPFKDEIAFHTLPTRNGETLSIRDNNQS